MTTTIKRATRYLPAATLPLIAALGLALPAISPAAQIPTEHVRISDLDLATPQGQQRLERRVRAAIEEVCVRPNSLVPRLRASRGAIEQCRSAAAASVQQQLVNLGVLPQTRAVRRD